MVQIKQILNKEDAKQFILELKNEDLNFHPDTPFEDYVNSTTGKPTYTPEEATLLNTLLSDCFKFYGDRLYTLSMFWLGVEQLLNEPLYRIANPNADEDKDALYRIVDDSSPDNILIQCVNSSLAHPPIDGGYYMADLVKVN